MTNEVLITYLCYLTEGNASRRSENFHKSLESMSLLQDQKCKVVAIKNSCTKDAEQKIDSQDGIDFSIKLKKNLWDISVIYAAAKIAKENNMKYCCYMYDDFVVYDNNFVEACVDFMNSHEDVACLRVPAYDYDKKHLYDSTVVPKSENPDSVRHYNTQTRERLKWEGPFSHKEKDFYKCNWHYTSRPTMWRTDILLSFFENYESLTVMQNFEGHGCKILADTGLKVGVLDKGAMHTFLESERNSSEESKGVTIKIPLHELEDSISGICKFSHEK